MTPSSDIIFDELPGRDGNLGRVVLNRPQALNALTFEMCENLFAQLKQWKENKAIKAIILRGAGDRAFSAGGDIRKVYEGKQVGVADLSHFFKKEYKLNQFIFDYPKPYISLLDGITMGGGAGISIHGSHRLATEKFMFAMPETGIGFFPDVGASHFLSRCPGKLGIYLGMTGARLQAADALHARLVNSFIPSEQLDDCVSALAKTSFSINPKQAVSDLLRKFHADPGESLLKQHQSKIDHFFSEETVEAIIEKLKTSKDTWAHVTLESLLKKSPTSLKITFREIRTASTLSFDECMKMEYRLAQHFVEGHDFYEGIRAVLIDKDQKPKWHPAHISEITDEMVEKYFSTY